MKFKRPRIRAFPFETDRLRIFVRRENPFNRYDI